MKRWKKHGGFPLISIPEHHEPGKERDAFSGKKHRVALTAKKKG